MAYVPPYMTALLVVSLYLSLPLSLRVTIQMPHVLWQLCNGHRLKMYAHMYVSRNMSCEIAPFSSYSKFPPCEGINFLHCFCDEQKKLVRYSSA